MKKILTFLCAGALLSAFCGIFVACDNDNIAKHRPKNEIRTVKLSSEVSASIDAYFKAIGWAPFLAASPILEYLDTNGGCAMINSADELPKVDWYGNSIELPAIDFEAYTLVVGFFVARNEGIHLVWQGIVPGEENAVLNLVLERSNGGTPQIVLDKFFWGLYPKITSESIYMNVAIND